ncbi:MAG: TIGR02452 family protein [Planctomycetota bacterium]|nr:TIGR02452 family protein [Planctomycetota bacterium]
MSRDFRAALAAETLAILDKGQYECRGQGLVIIKADQEKAELGTVTFSEERLGSLRDSLPKVLGGLLSQVELSPETTMACGERLVQREGEESVVALNFASAKNPGGGFIKGSQAQEEALSRSSGLYPCLQGSELYRFNKGRRSALYSDMMIYSPDVPFFRNDAGDLLESSYKLSVITSPAVNAGVVRRQEQKNKSKIRSVMRDRCALVLALARHYGHKTLILGAWGCGVFRNDPRQIAEIFKDVLESEEFAGAFRRVVFAVPIFRKDRTNYNAFETVISNS